MISIGAVATSLTFAADAVFAGRGAEPVSREPSLAW